MFSEWKVLRINEARKLEDIPRHELDAVVQCAVFSLKLEKKWSRIRSRNFGGHDVLGGPSFKKLWQKLQYSARYREFANSRQQLPAERIPLEFR